MSIQFNPNPGPSDWAYAFGDPSPCFEEEPSAPPAQNEVAAKPCPPPAQHPSPSPSKSEAPYGNVPVWPDVGSSWG